MTKFYLVAALFLLPLCGLARTLTANEALTRVNSSSNEAARKIAGAQPRLVASGEYDGVPSYYIFSGKSDAMILSANSLAVPVIGYLDAPVDDMTPIPEQLQWWLDKIAQAVARAESENDRLYANGALQGVAPSGEANLKSLQKGKAAKAAHSDIAPLCQTKWNQDSPYNDLCPLSDGQRTYTGCVATAQAQAMKYYEYPASGTGTVSTTFNGRTYSMVLDGQALQWNLMTDTYSSSSTTAQKTAVATLMKAVGYSVKMQYGLDGSGTKSYYIVRSLVDNFNYDKAADIQERIYYTDDQWSEKLYADIAAGMPVLYSGTGEAGGHQFICDGYRSSDGYFHFNWGWGGVYDGMFSIDALEPEGQGIGGNGSNFNDNQTAIFGCRKPIDGSEKQIWMGAYGQLSGSVDGRALTLEITYGYYNSSPWDSSFDIGFVITDSAGKATYHNIASNYSIATNYGIGNLTCNIPTSYGDGSYTIVPAYRISGKSAWYPVKIPVDSPQAVNFKISNGKVSLDEVEKDWVFSAWQTSTGFKAGSDFDVIVSASNPNSQEQTKRLFAAIVDPSSYNIMSEYENYIQEITVPSNNFRRVTYDGKIPSSCPAGNYYVCIIDADEWAILAAANVTVEAADDANIKVESLTITPESPAVGSVFGTSLQLANTGTAAGTVDYDFYFCDVDPDKENSLRVLGTAGSASFTVAPNTAKTYTVGDCHVPSDLEAGNYYYVVAQGNSIAAYTSVEVKSVNDSTGIDSTDADGQLPVLHYDLQGRPAGDNSRGIIIQTDGTTTKKQIRSLGSKL